MSYADDWHMLHEHCHNYCKASNEDGTTLVTDKENTDMDQIDSCDLCDQCIYIHLHEVVRSKYGQLNSSFFNQAKIRLLGLGQTSLFRQT